MTIFLSDSLPQQPAFIYASYPDGTVMTASDAGDPSAVLQADEADGYTFADPSGSPYLVITYPVAAQVDCVALHGLYLSGASIAVYGSNDGFVADNNLLLAATPLSDDRTYWMKHTSGTFLSYKYVLTGLNSSHKIKHLSPALLTPLPFLADGFCAAPVQAKGDHLVSAAGLFLGSVTLYAVRDFSLNFGQITPVEETLFAAMVSSCVTTAQGFFFIPDTGGSTVHFGYIDKGYKYQPKMKTGLYTIPAIPFISRAS